MLTSLRRRCTVQRAGAHEGSRRTGCVRQRGLGLVARAHHGSLRCVRNRRTVATVKFQARAAQRAFARRSTRVPAWLDDRRVQREAELLSCRRADADRWPSIVNRTNGCGLADARPTAVQEHSDFWRSDSRSRPPRVPLPRWRNVTIGGRSARSSSVVRIPRHDKSRSTAHPHPGANGPGVSINRIRWRPGRALGQIDTASHRTSRWVTSTFQSRSSRDETSDLRAELQRGRRRDPLPRQAEEIRFSRTTCAGLHGDAGAGEPTASVLALPRIIANSFSDRPEVAQPASDFVQRRA